MRILIGNDNYSAHFFERMGLAKAFMACGHTIHMWHLDKQPAHDVFDEFEPDILLFQTYNLNRAVIECIAKRPRLKCIMKAGEWGPLWDTVDRSKYEVLIASEEEKANTLRLFKMCGQPSYLYIYYHPDWLEDSFGYWMKQGLRVHSHMLAADIFDYTNGTPRPEFKCDLGFLGGYWPYKARVLDEYLIPICRESKIRIKIFGNSIWPVHQYSGSIDNSLVKDFFASCIICPNLHEPHSQDLHRDMNERTFKLLSNQCFVISDYVEGLAKIFNKDEIVFAHNPDEFKELVYHYVKYPDERKPYIDRGYKSVLTQHTYLDRIRDIFLNLGMVKEAEKVETKKGQILVPREQ